MTIGFLGRLSPDKGILELAQALALIEADRPGRVRLLLAGEPRSTHPDAPNEPGNLDASEAIEWYLRPRDRAA